MPISFEKQEIQKGTEECVKAVEDLIFELQINQFDAMIDNTMVYVEDIRQLYFIFNGYIDDLKGIPL